MYPSYNIPQQRQSMQSSSYYGRPSYSSRPVSSSGDRLFWGGGFLGPFLLGGVAGSLISRPNYGYNYGPPPVIYYPPPPYYTNNYYYR